jgi:hypothetical protein
VGPEYHRNFSAPTDVQKLVSEWWEMKKDSGQAGVNAEIMRQRIIDDELPLGRRPET